MHNSAISEVTAPCDGGSCSRKCMLLIVSSFYLSENKCASRDMQAFFRDFGRKDLSVSQMQHMYRVFLRYMRAKKYIECNVGMFYLEKYILLSHYKTLLFDKWEATRNQFINNKVALYQWIRPDFLDAKVSSAYIQDVSVFCDMISNVHTPTEKLYCIIEISRLVYKHGGDVMGQEDFLPVFIFTFIHLQTKDLLFNLLYIQRYKPVPITRCYTGCTHMGVFPDGLQDSCECTIRVPSCNAKETTFYLTNFEAAVAFIERLEYRDLKVDRDTYNMHIEKYCSKIDTACLDVRRDGFVTKMVKDIMKRMSSFLDLIGAGR